MAKLIYGGPESRHQPESRLQQKIGDALVDAGPAPLAASSAASGATCGAASSIALSWQTITSACTTLTLPAAPEPTYRSSGIPAIDRLLGGKGFHIPSFVLLVGPVGTGKCKLALSLIKVGDRIFDDDCDRAFSVRREYPGGLLTFATCRSDHPQLTEYMHAADVVLRLMPGRATNKRILTCDKNRFGRLDSGRVEIHRVFVSGEIAHVFRYVILARTMKARKKLTTAE